MPLVPKTTLVIGGCRSGKSRHALSLGEKSCGSHNLFVATCQPHDAEMKDRIQRHQQERGAHWKTVEAPLDIVGVIDGDGEVADVILIDCLTLWVSNLMMAYENDDDAIAERISELSDAILSPPCPIILVTNEVGAGIVPENPLARRFRDLTGWCNQRIAAGCTDVVWMVAGIAAAVKTSID